VRRPNPDSPKILAKALREARERIQVCDDELTEARRRRGLLAECLRREFGPDSRTYVNGSIAHGDALTPLTDIDLGVVVPNPDGNYGPWAKGPEKLQQRAADAIRRDLKEEFPDLRVTVGGRKRSVYVAFGDPVDPDVDDFSADVIVALDHPAQGLWIPNYTTWDRSDPEAHTRMVRDAVATSKVNYSKTVRLLKHWARRHSKPLCSWNIKALALGCLAVELDQLQGMVTWFDHAISELSWQETPDPAGVAGPISLPGDRMELVAKLKKARDKLAEAIAFANDGYDTLAVEALATFFNDSEMLPHPDPDEVAKQASQRALDLRMKRSASTTASAASQVRHRTAVRSWAP
jgi:predicted nucleotidyltransferase